MRLIFDLRRARLEKGKSQQEIAEEAEVSQGTWSRAERGLKVEPEQARNIADYFGKTPGDLWDFDSEVAAA